MNGIPTKGNLTSGSRPNGPRTRGIGHGLAMFAVAAGLTVAATGCAAGPSHPAGAAHPAGTSAGPSTAGTAGRPPAVTSATVAAARLQVAPGTPQAGGYHGPHFTTPQAAMRYLAAAYNHHNATELHHVTTPASYRELRGMRSEAVNLRLRSCTLNRGHGDYTCYFIHDYPASLHKPGHGASTFIAAPALNPGWYMYALLECG